MSKEPVADDVGAEATDDDDLAQVYARLRMADWAPRTNADSQVRLDGKSGWLVPGLLGLDPHGPEERSVSGTRAMARPLLVLVVLGLILIVYETLGGHALVLALLAFVAAVVTFRILRGRLFGAPPPEPESASPLPATRVRTAASRAVDPFNAVLIVYVWMLIHVTRSDGAVVRFDPTFLALVCLPLCWSLFRAFVLFGPGDVEVTFEPHPVPAGDWLLVRIAAGAHGAAVRRMDLCLRCVVPNPHGPEHHSEVLAVQRNTLDAAADLPDPGGAIEVSFPIPPDAPASDPDRAVWRLDLRIWCGFGSFTEMMVLPVAGAPNEADESDESDEA